MSSRPLFRLLPLFLALLLLGGCEAPLRNYQERIYIFGTEVDINLWGVTETRARQVLTELRQDFEHEHHDWHAWQSGPLVELNRAIARGEPHETLPSIIRLIEQSQRLSRASGGLFSPAIGGLIDLWGFHQDIHPGGPPPAEEAIRRWLEAAPSMDDLSWEGNTVTSTNPAVQLDFGGFAKGYAVDRAIEKLRARGIENAIVNAGGDLRAIGSKDGEPWRIGVRHPQGQGEQGVLAAIAVKGDESVFTSGNYERYNEYQGVRYAHILDPRTGMPVQGITSVTVLHDNGAEADAAATALVVAGAEEWPAVAARMGIAAVMLVEESGLVHLSPAMAERVEFTGERPEVRITELPPPPPR